MSFVSDVNLADETVIELSKAKLVLIMLGAGAFVAAGAWMLSLDAAAVSSERSFAYFFNDATFVRGLGLVTVVFFGFCGLYAARALFDKKPGLILSRAGIVDNASAVSAGFIPWSDVAGAGVLEIEKQKMLVIQVRSPQKYIGRGGPLRRALNRANYKMVGSSITIPAITLKIDFAELVSLFNQYQRTYAAGADTSGPMPMRHAHTPATLPEHVGPGERLLNWSPVAVKGTLGSGGIAILVLTLSSLDLLFRIQPPFWAGFAASMLPALIFFLAVPDFLPIKIVRPAQWVAVVWYLVFAALAILLSVSRGLESVDFLLVGFVLLGVWPCIVAIRGLRAGRAT